MYATSTARRRPRSAVVLEERALGVPLLGVPLWPRVRYEARVASDPAQHAMDYVHSYLHVSKA